MENETKVPDEIKKWNWGAMLLSPFWCLRHGVWQGFLLLIPPLTFFMPFVLGARGNVWGWKKGQSVSPAQFLRRQKFWAVGGIAIWILFFGAFFFGLNYSTGISRAITIANSNSRLVNYLGTPIKKSSLFTGANSYTNNGNLTQQFISLPSKGSKGEGKIDFWFEKVHGHWLLQKLELTEKNGTQLQLVDSPTIQASCSRSVSEKIHKLPSIINQIATEKDGFLILTRSNALNDFLQAAIEFDNEGKMGFEILYSHGYNRRNKQIYRMKELIYDKEKLTELFYQYASGSDSHIQEMEWAKLQEIQESEQKGMGAFIFEP